MQRISLRSSNSSMSGPSSVSSDGIIVARQSSEAHPAFAPPPRASTYEVSITSDGRSTQPPVQCATTGSPARPDPPATTTSKPFFLQVVRSFSLHSLATDLGGVDDPKWQPTWLRPLPLAGLGALLISICCLFAALGILVGSDGQPSEDWPWPPSVFLAMFSAIMGRTTEFALVSAIPIAWWSKAYQGATISQLQRRWEAGEGVFRALKNVRHEPILAVATLAAVLVVIDGPFLQKASSVVSQTQVKPTTLSFPITTELPRGFSGQFGSGGVTTSDSITPVLDGFTQNNTIRANVIGCQGTCRGSVLAPGMHVKNCSTKSWDLTSEMLLHNASSTWGSGQSRHLPPMPIFNTQILDSALHPPFIGPEEVELVVGTASLKNCSGRYVETACTLVAAILEYEINVRDGNAITFARPASEARLVGLPNNTHVDSNDTEIPLTFTALGAFLDGQIFSNVSMVPASDPREQGAAVMPEQDSFNNFATRYAIEMAICESEFRDPTADILSDFNNLMVRSAIIAAGLSNSTAGQGNGVTLNQNITANQTLTLNVFQSDLEWFAGAVIFQVFAVLTIIPVYFGFWKLGLRATMSPLDLAKAFEAPLLKNVNSAAGSRGIVKAMGDVKVRLGQATEQRVDDPEKGFVRSRLAIAEADGVVTPQKGTRFDA